MLKSNEHLPFFERLTKRETEILTCLADGLSNTEIGNRLFLAPSTIKWYVRQLNSKFGTETRRAIVTRAQQLGLLDGTVTQPVAKHNLPAPTTPFIGRVADLDALYRLLSLPDVRLLTVLAPGGMGKTRLALEAAAQQLTNFTHGVYFVPLQSLAHSGHIFPAIAEHIGCQFQEDGRESQPQVLDYLNSKHLLLVLDNYEHLLDGAPLITDILHAAPSVKVLATSREKLNLSGETVYNLGGMQFSTEASEPMEAYDAVELLVRTAQRVRPDFMLIPDDFPAVRRICQLVEGLPLGIELAAGWVDVLPLPKIADELQHGIDLLETEFRDIPERHRSIRATFRATWERLSPAEQSAFMSLPVFRGGFTTEAAQAVVGADVRLLRRLVNKALLRQPSPLRYDLHELLRQYAQEQLETAGEVDTLRDVHLNYYANILHAREADLKGRRQLEALDEIEADFENIRAAWQWAVTSKAYAAVDHALDGLTLYCYLRARYRQAVEMLQLARESLVPACGEAPHPVWERVSILWLGRATDKAQNERALAMARKHGSLMDFVHCWSMQRYYDDTDQGFAGLKSLAQAALTHAHELNDDFYTAAVVYYLSDLHLLTGQPEEAMETAQHALRIRKAIGDKFGTAISLDWLGHLMYLAGRHNDSERCRREALAIAREIGSSYRIGFFGAVLSWIRLEQGDFEEVRSLIADTLAIAEANNYPLVKEAAAVITSLIMSMEEDYLSSCELIENTPRDSLETYLHNLFHYARSIAHCGSGNLVKAWENTAEALIWGLRFHAVPLMTRCLPVSAVILSHRNQKMRAVELLGLAFTHPASATGWMEQWPLLSRLRAALETELGTETYQTVWKRGAALNLETVVNELLEELSR